MQKKEYSAGMVKLSFWFQEFRQVLLLVNQGKTFAEIGRMNTEENIFMASSAARANLIFTTVVRRIKALNPSFYPLFEAGDLATQKLINLIATMAVDQLFFDFVYEVYREKLIIGVAELADSDLAIFFKNKQIQSDKVAGWTDETIKRLSRAYKTNLMEAGVIDQTTGNRKILKPILDRSLEDCLIQNGMAVTLHALTGVR